MAVVSVIPAVVDAILTGARTALPNLNVYDGSGVTDDPGDFLMVGDDDPNATGSSHSADSVQDWAHANNTARDESGDVTCTALSWNGDGDQKGARDKAFATCDAVAAFLRVDPSLGGAVLWSSYGTSTQYTQTQSSAGALAQVVFTVHFRARI